VNKVYGCGSRSLIEDVLDLLERVSCQNVGEPQLRRSRILAGVQGVARYEDRRPRSDGPRVAVDRDRAGSFEDEVDLGLLVPMLEQRFARGIFAMPMVSASLWVWSPLTRVFQ
jgi:hypothetical protein